MLTMLALGNAASILVHVCTVFTHLLGTLSYLGHLVIFKTAKDSVTWDTHVKGDPLQILPDEKKYPAGGWKNTLSERGFEINL